MLKSKILLISIVIFSLSSNAQTKIIMKKEQGVYKIPCKIQDVEMEFILDTGASEVSISITEALFLIKNGNINKYNLLGYSEAQLANGEIIENTKLLIDNLKIGNIELENIKATIIHNSSAPLLLGQSVLKKLGKIDITGNILTIYPKKEGYYNNKYYDKNKFIFIAIDNKSYNYENFKNEYASSISKEMCQFHLQDLNNDNTPEIIIQTYSGGANCCTNLHIFKWVSKNTYEEIKDLELGGGEIKIIIDENIEFYNYDLFRYYHCPGSVFLELPNYIPYIDKYYCLGSTIIENYIDEQFNSAIIENLEYLLKNAPKELPTENDNGYRRAFLSELFKFQKYNNNDWNNTRKLLDFYYNYSDKEMLWSDLKKE